MKNLIVSSLALLLTQTVATMGAESSAEWPAGVWKGNLQAGGQQMEIVYHLSLDADGDWTGAMDVPAQGALGLPLQSIDVANDSISLVMPLPGEANYQGQWQADSGRIQGRFNQAGQSFAMELERVPVSSSSPVRPQEPKRPLPYRSQSIVFSNAGTALAGTLTLPEDQVSYLGVVLVAGAGPQDRDGTFMNHRPLLVLADYLTRSGFAVLRFDERGIGESEGNYALASADQMAGDIASAANLLRGHESVNAEQIAIIAHSEGGRLSALAIESFRAADALVLLGAPARPGGFSLRTQAAQSSNPMTGLQAAMAAAILALDSGSNAEAAMRTAAEQFLAELEVDRLDAFGGNQEIIIDQLIQALGQPQSQFTLSFDPRPALSSADLPVLVLYGALDAQIDAFGAAEAWRTALGSRGEVRILSKLNHLFQEAKTGSPTEYAKIEQTISPTVLSTIERWLQSNVE